VFSWLSLLSRFLYLAGRINLCKGEAKANNTSIARIWRVFSAYWENPPTLGVGRVTPFVRFSLTVSHASHLVLAGAANPRYSAITLVNCVRRAVQLNMPPPGLTQVRHDAWIVLLGGVSLKWNSGRSTPLKRECAASSPSRFLVRPSHHLTPALREPRDNSLIRRQGHLADDLRGVIATAAFLWIKCTTSTQLPQLLTASR